MVLRLLCADLTDNETTLINYIHTSVFDFIQDAL